MNDKAVLDLLYNLMIWHQTSYNDNTKNIIRETVKVIARNTIPDTPTTEAEIWEVIEGLRIPKNECSREIWDDVSETWVRVLGA